MRASYRIRTGIIAVAAFAACNREPVEGGALGPGGSGEAATRAVLAGFPPDTELVAWSPDESVLVVRHSRRCAGIRNNSDVGDSLCVATAEAVDVATGRRVRLTRGFPGYNAASGVVKPRFGPTSRTMLVLAFDGVPERPVGLYDRKAFKGYLEWINLATGARRRLTRGGPTSIGRDDATQFDNGDAIPLVEIAGDETRRFALMRLSTGTVTPLPAELRGDWWNTHVSADGRSWYYVPEGGGLWAGGFDQTPRLIAPRVNAVQVSADRRWAVVWIGEPPPPGVSAMSGERRVVTLPEFTPTGPADADDCQYLYFDPFGTHLVCLNEVRGGSGPYPVPRRRIWNSYRRVWVPEIGSATFAQAFQDGRVIAYTRDDGQLCYAGAEDSREACAAAPPLTAAYAGHVDAPRAARTVWCVQPNFATVCVAAGPDGVVTSGTVGVLRGGGIQALSIDAAGDIVRGLVTFRDEAEGPSALWEWHIPTNTARWMWRGASPWFAPTPTGIVGWWFNDDRGGRSFALMDMTAAADTPLRVRSSAAGPATDVLAGRRRIAVARGDGTVTIDPAAAFGEAVPPLNQPAGGDMDWEQGPDI